MNDVLMYIRDYNKQNYSSVDYNKWLKRLDIQLNEPTNQNSIEVPKLSSRVRKYYYKTLGTSVINSEMSPPSLEIRERLQLLLVPNT